MNNRIIFYLAIALYVLSMFLPGIIARGGVNGEIFTLYGYWILLFGALGLLKLIFSWYANLIFIFILIAGKKEKPKNIFIGSVIAFILGLTALGVRSLPNLDTADSIVDHLAVGYYVWMASLALFVVYSYRKLKEVDTSQPKITEALSMESSKII